MVRRKWIKTLYAALASTGLALGQDAGVPPTATGERIVTVQEMDRPGQKCRLLHSWRLPDGAQAYLVRALDSDELITVVETGRAGAPADGKRQLATRIFHWGKGTTPPAGTPAPPNFHIEAVTARTSVPATAAPTPAPVVTRTTVAQPQVVEIQPGPKTAPKVEMVTAAPAEEPRKTLVSVLRDRKAEHVENTPVVVKPAPTPASLPTIINGSAGPTSSRYPTASQPVATTAKPTVAVQTKPAATTAPSAKPAAVVNSKPTTVPAAATPAVSPYAAIGQAPVAASSLPTTINGSMPAAPMVVSTSPYGGRIQTPAVVTTPAKPMEVQTVLTSSAKPQGPELFTVPPKPVKVEAAQTVTAPKMEIKPAATVAEQYTPPAWSDDVLKRFGDEPKPTVKAEPPAPTVTPAMMPELAKAPDLPKPSDMKVPAPKTVETVKAMDTTKTPAPKTVETVKAMDTTKTPAPTMVETAKVPEMTKAPAQTGDWRQSWGKPEVRTTQADAAPTTQVAKVEPKKFETPGKFDLPPVKTEKKAEPVQWSNMTRSSQKKVETVVSKADLPQADVARPDPLRNPAGYSKSPLASELGGQPVQQSVTPIVAGSALTKETASISTGAAMPSMPVPGTPLGTQSVVAAGQNPSQVQFVPVPIVTVPDVQNMPAPPPAQVPRAPQPITNAPRMAVGNQGILPNAFSQPHEMPAPELTPPGPPMANAFTPSGAAPAAGGPGVLAQGMPMPGGMMPPRGPGMLPPMAYSGPAAPVVNAGYQGPMPYHPAMVPAGTGYPMATPAMPPAAQHPAPTQAAPSLQDLMGILRDALLPSQREWAADQMAMVNWQANPQVVTCLATGSRKDPAPMVRAACVRCLAKLKANTPEVVAAVQASQADADPRVQHEATQALAAMGAGSSSTQPAGYVAPK